MSFARIAALSCGLAAALVVAEMLAEPPSPEAPAPSLPDQLRQAVTENLATAQSEDIDAHLRTLHPKSPLSVRTAAVVKQLMSAYDLEYELRSFRFLGADETYAVARVRQKTTRLRGPKFRDNITDLMHVFRRDGQAWKLWQTAVLDVQFLDKPPTRPAPEAPRPSP